MSTPEKTELEVQRELLASYRECELAIISGAQEYTVGAGSTQRRLVRPKIEEIHRAIATIEARIVSLTPSRATRRGIVYARPYR